ncbi:hypothetical protein ABT340_15670 [Streptosporangium sp. NPDC000239]|uniref:hypothetical protein n=1 Tax=Streptosporangium sp. NPDC000239 TaxID=3154248 RepID=UPI00332AC8F2
MIDFEYGAHPHRDGLAMISGAGETKGLTMRRRERISSTTWEFHEAYVVREEKVCLIGTCFDQWEAFSLIEGWYRDQTNYFAA